MASVIIPISLASGQSSEKVTLEGTVYTLGFRWNDRMACWMFDIGDANGTPILQGLPIREGFPVNYPYTGRYAGLPPGVFQALDTTGKHTEPSLTNFGVDVLFYYLPSSG